MRGNPSRKKMKIAFIVDHFPSVTQTFILNQITGLLDRGHNVVIFTKRLSDDVHVHKEIDTYQLLYRTTSIGCLSDEMPRNIFFRIIKGGGYVLRYVWSNPLPILEALNFFHHGKKAASLYLLYQTVAVLKWGQFDIIHCQFGTLGIDALYFRKLGLLNGKLVVAFRGYDVTQYLQSKPGIYDSLYKKSDLFFPVSNVLENKIIDNGCPKEKIFVHHSGIDCLKFEYKNRCLLDGEPVSILTVARLTEKKGISYAIKAVARILSSGRNVMYTVVGDGKLRDDLQNLIDDLGIEKKVHLVGWKNQTDIIFYMQKAHILLAPSIVASNGDEEGIPNVIKEAMAVGLPVVSTLHGGIPELVDNGVSGILVHERNVDELEDRLVYLIDHPEKWLEMGMRGREKVLSFFNIEKLNDTLIEKYQQLLDGTDEIHLS